MSWRRRLPEARPDSSQDFPEPWTPERGHESFQSAEMGYCSRGRRGYFCGSRQFGGVCDKDLQSSDLGGHDVDAMRRRENDPFVPDAPVLCRSRRLHTPRQHLVHVGPVHGLPRLVRGPAFIVLQ
jgi:hypothetical protein